MIAKASGVVGERGIKPLPRVYIFARGKPFGVAEIVGVFTAGEAGAGGGLYGDKAVIRLAAQLSPMKGR